MLKAEGTIRLAEPEDVNAVMRIVRRAVPLMLASGNQQWNENYPNAEVFAKDERQGELWVVAGTSADRMAIVGAMTLTTEPSLEYVAVGWDLNEPSIVAHRLVVDPEARGQGIAKLLLRHAEELARSRKVGVIRLDTNTQNRAMRQLLKKLSYRYAGEISLTGREGLRFCCYEKRL